MKYLVIAVLFLSLFSEATTTVTGKIQNLGTGNVTSGAFARFWLRGCGGNQPRINGTSVIGPSQGGVFFFDITSDASGNVSGTIYSTRDNTGLLGGDIECGGSHTSVWYGLQLFSAGKGGPEVAIHAKSGASLDITSVTPITVNPVITAPSGDSTYARLDTGNQPFVGNIQATNVTATNQLKSTVATGTAPLSVLSTTVVPNLNSSFLLGLTWPVPGTIGSTTPNTGAFTTLSATGQITSTLAIGTAPFVITSTTLVANLNVSQLLGGTWAIPGTIGSTTPNTGVFSTLQANTSFTLNGSTAQTAVQGTDSHLMSAGTVSGTGNPLCVDANGGATTTCSGTGPIFAPQRKILLNPQSISLNTQTTVTDLTETVTFPAGAGTYRADVRYGMWVTVGANLCVAQVIDTTNTRGFALSGQNTNGSGFIGMTGSEISPQTYAASATAVFTLQIECNANTTVTVLSGAYPTFTTGESTYLSVTPILSN
jgi:hypothetical protein